VLRRLVARGLERPEDDNHSLLRGAEYTAVESDVLLRAAGSGPPPAPDDLLRPSTDGREP